MAKYITSKQIIKAIGCDKLELVRGEGYWYFVYDDKGDKYDTRSVPSMYLGSDAAFWISEGKDFVQHMEQKS